MSKLQLRKILQLFKNTIENFAWKVIKTPSSIIFIAKCNTIPRTLIPKTIINIAMLMAFTFNISPSYPWEIVSSGSVYTSNLNWGIRNTTGDFKLNWVDDGTSVLRVDNKPPTENSQQGTTVEGKGQIGIGNMNVALFHSFISDGINKQIQFSFSMYPSSSVEKFKTLQSGVVYFWYGDKLLKKINYSFDFVPFVRLNAPTSPIDLGLCHKYHGGIISKPLSITITPLGIFDVPFKISRQLDFIGQRPNGANIKTSSGQDVLPGVITTLNSLVTTSGAKIDDNFVISLNCDEADVGMHTWIAKFNYTIE